MVKASPSQLGVTLSRSATQDRDGPAFVTAVHTALGTEISAADRDVASALERANDSAARPLKTAVDHALANCVGEIGVDPSAPPLDAERLEEAREASLHPDRVSFSAVGPAGLLRATSGALSRLSDWGTTEPSAPNWPPADVIATSPPGNGTAKLRVAVRLANPGRALAAASNLNLADSRLALRVQTFGSAWSLRSVSATTQRFGACVGVDVEGHGERDAATAAALARAIIDEIGIAARAAAHPDWSLNEAVLSVGDAGDAARAAAWRGLTHTARQQPTRSIVRYAPANQAANTAEFSTSFRQPAFSNIPTRTRLEKGQGELYALAATGCGLTNESGSAAGALAVALQAVSQKPTMRGVSIAPLIRPDMMGLVARTRRLTPDESPRRTAERAAAALGTVLAARSIDGPSATAARDLIMRALGGTPRPAYAALVEALSPGHPSWLDPRGTWSSAQGLSADDVETARRAFIQGDLRLAVLANAKRSQGRSGEARIRTMASRHPRPRRLKQPAHGSRQRVLMSAPTPLRRLVRHSP